MRCWRAILLLAVLASCSQPAAPNRSTASDAEAKSGGTADASRSADVTPTAAESPAGVWYLAAGDQRLVVTIAQTPAWSATVRDEAADPPADVSATVAWNATSGRIALDWSGHHLSADVSAGVLSGRLCPDSALCAQHVTGWNATVLDAESTSRVYELLIDGTWKGRLRLTGTGSGTIGTFKIYASVANGVQDEGLAYDIQVVASAGQTLDFFVQIPEGAWLFTCVVQGRQLSGSLQRPGAEPTSLTGQRAEVLSHGLLPRKDRQGWQAVTRLRLERLMMAGHPAAVAAKVTVLQPDLPPQPSVNLSKHRDDDAPSQPQAYRLNELAFASTLPDPQGGPPLQRTAHAWLAVPTTPAPPGGFPAALALNGHYGSAANTMDPASDDYWYGDALARRGFVVLALDVGHRPLEDRKALYTDMVTGDDAGLGNAPHPAIRRAGADSDWEEEGERVWDAMRALDHLAALPNVDARRLFVTGLSMGGELTTWVGALDTRVKVSVVAGFSPDLGVLQDKPNNHPCWRWQHGDLREYVDMSDVEALTAPRRLVVETGQNDASFSMRQPPFASDKQVLQRTRLAYGADATQLIHYLHDGEHAWRTALVPPGIRTPQLQAPKMAGDVDWESDGQTLLMPVTLLDVLAAP